MLPKNQFTLRVLLTTTASFAVWFALAHIYGWGRALVCLIVLFQGISSIFFFIAARHCLVADHWRNALASLVLGILILVGAILLSLIVFQPPVHRNANLGSQANDEPLDPAIVSVA